MIQKIKEWSGVASLLVSVIILVSLVGGNQSASKSPSFGGTTNYDSIVLTPTNAQEGLKVGTTTTTQFASTLNLVYATSTAFTISNATIVASTTANVDLAVVGVQPGDFVLCELNASSTLVSQFIPRGCVASSTPAFVTMSLYNATGGNALPSATNGFGSSTDVLVYRIRN